MNNRWKAIKLLDKHGIPVNETRIERVEKHLDLGRKIDIAIRSIGVENDRRFVDANPNCEMLAVFATKKAWIVWEE